MGGASLDESEGESWRRKDGAGTWCLLRSVPCGGQQMNARCTSLGTGTPAILISDVGRSLRARKMTVPSRGAGVREVRCPA